MTDPTSTSSTPDPASLAGTDWDAAWAAESPLDPADPTDQLGRPHHTPGPDDRVPPQDMAAEQSVLGSMMLSRDAIADVTSTLDAGDYYRPAHQTIHTAILDLYARSEPADPITVAAELQRIGELARVGAAPYLHTLTANVPIAANAGYYAEIVREKAVLRRLVEAGTKIAQIGYTGAGRADDSLDQARTALTVATNTRDTTTSLALGDALPDFLDEVQTGAAPTLATGWPDIDRILTGLAPGRLVVIAARPGGGKSLSGFNLAEYFAHHHGHAAHIASMEMPRKEVIARLLANHANVDLRHILEAKLDDTEWARIADHYGTLGALPITIDDTPEQSVTHIAKTVRAAKEVRDDLALVVVDYLQLVAPPRGSRKGDTSRAEIVTTIARNLKLLARDTDTCVVALAQVNRNGAKNPGGKPRMEDLREGGIENDADQVILLHRPDLELPEVHVEIAKNRHGPMGTATLLLQGHYARLASTEWTPWKGAGQ